MCESASKHICATTVNHCLLMSAYLLLAAGDPVEADLVQAAGVELVDAVDDDGGHHGRGARHVVRQLAAAAQCGLARGSLFMKMKI